MVMYVRPSDRNDVARFDNIKSKMEGVNQEMLSKASPTARQELFKAYDKANECFFNLLDSKYEKHTLNNRRTDADAAIKNLDKAIKNLTTDKKKTGLFAKMRRMRGYIQGIGWSKRQSAFTLTNKIEALRATEKSFINPPPKTPN